jgi:hypothetical protein
VNRNSVRDKRPKTPPMTDGANVDVAGSRRKKARVIAAAAVAAAAVAAAVVAAKRTNAVDE